MAGSILLEGPLVTAFKPAVSHREKKIDVVARIPIAEAGAGKVSDRAFEEKCLMALHEDVAAKGDARSEVHLRSISGGDVLPRENNTADGRYVWCDGATAGEIPLPDCRADAAAPYGARRRKDNIHGQDVRSPLEIPAQQTGEEVSAQDDSASAAGIAELSSARVAKARAGSGEES